MEPINLLVEDARCAAAARPPDRRRPAAAWSSFPTSPGPSPCTSDMCQRLASHGLAVCAVECFSRQEDAAGGPLESTPASLWHPSCSTTRSSRTGRGRRPPRRRRPRQRRAILGFCMGGSYALKAASTGRFDRAVSFYGMVRTPEQWQGGGHARAARHGDHRRCPTLAIFGDRATRGSPPRTWSAAGRRAGQVDHKVVVYRVADHGFVHDPDRPSYRPADVADAGTGPSPSCVTERVGARPP